MKTGTKILIAILALFVFLGILYSGLAYYFVYPTFNSSKTEKMFTYGTYINGNNCSGLTAKEVEDMLQNTVKVSDIEILTLEGKSVIPADKVNFRASFHDEVKTIIDKQIPMLWAKNIINPADYSINPSYTYDEGLFKSEFDKLGLDKCNLATNDVYIELSDEGYVLVDNKADHFNIDAFKESVIENINNGILVVRADDSFYEKTSYTENEKQLMEFYEELSKHQSRIVTYHFGKETKTINGYEWDKLFIDKEKLPEKFTDYNKAKNSFNFEVDEDKAVAYIDEFLDEYNSLNNRYFKGHNGAWVHVTKGNYGNKIDVKREEDWFKDYVNSNDASTNRTPVYLTKAKYQEKNDFGDTYIEVSLDEQHMWYYVDGEIYVETDVTTGSMAHGGTDPRVVSVYSIIPNKWLNGPTWHNFVKYWVAIQGAIGIHDASWRSVYGGTEYIHNGSHGCINTPHDAMQKLFERVELGTPVIVYSIERNGVESRD